VDLSLVPIDGADEVMVERVTKLGFEVRVQLALTGGGSVWSQVTRAEAEELELVAGQIVWARPRHAKVFENGGGPSTAELTLA
jgi:sulfate transport system ATP-binding protein